MAEAAQINVVEFTVTELSAALKRTVEDAYGYVRVRGEISGYKGPHTSGHVYFAIKDEGAKIEAVIWKGVFGRMRVKPTEGLEVVITGKLTTYPNRSSYQIIVETLEPAGLGALMALLEERKKMLAAEGLFDEARKQLLPFLPTVIGVVTSPTGAVIRDILHRLADRFPRKWLLMGTTVVQTVLGGGKWEEKKTLFRDRLGGWLGVAREAGIFPRLASYESLRWYGNGTVQAALWILFLISFSVNTIAGAWCCLARLFRRGQSVALPASNSVVNLKRAIGALNLLILVALTITVLLVVDQLHPSCPTVLLFIPLLGTVSTLATVALLIVLVRTRREQGWTAARRIRFSLDVLCFVLFVPYMFYWDLFGVRF
jgi:hypothetical protein